MIKKCLARKTRYTVNIDGLVLDRNNFIANTLELL